MLILETLSKFHFGMSIKTEAKFTLSEPSPMGPKLEVTPLVVASSVIRCDCPLKRPFSSGRR